MGVWIWLLRGVLALLALVGALILLLLVVPVYGRLTYREELRLRLWVLGIPVTVFPEKLKRVKKAKKSAPGRKKVKKVEKAKKPSALRQLKTELAEAFRRDGVAASLRYLTRLAQLAGTALRDVLRAVTVARLELHLRIAAEEAADTAVEYGRVCAIVFPGLATLERWLPVRRRVTVEPDFLREQSAAQLEVRFHVRLWRLLWAAVVFLVRYLTDDALRGSEEPKE